MSDGKWERVEQSFDRAHSDLFSASDYTAEFFNTTQGTRDNLTDTYSGETRESIGTIQIEVVPPAMDTTVDSEGTTFSWDTSIRFPEDESIVGSLIPLGENNRKPTEVEIEDNEDGSTDVFELHGYSYEKGSGMIMCRLVEQ